MNTGRKYAWKLKKEAGHGRQTTIDEFFGSQGPPALPFVRAGRIAASQFWSLLQGFAVLHRWPTFWIKGQTLPVVHPFLASDPDTDPLDGVGAIRVVPRT